MDFIENFLLTKLDLRLSNRHFAKEQILNNAFEAHKIIALIEQANEKQKINLLCFCDTFSRAYVLYFEDYFQYFIDLATNETYETNKRSLTNIYMCILETENDKLTIDQKNTLTEICFSWLINESFVATKSNCISCLYLLSKDNEWICIELKALVEQMYPQMPVSFQSRARKILKKLQCG